MIGVATLLPLLSGGIGAIGDLLGGSQQKQAANDQANVMDSNAHLGELEAANALARGYVQSNGIYRGAMGVTSGQSMAAAGSGLDMNNGMPSNLFDDTTYLSSLDAHTAQRNARLQYNQGMDQAAIMRQQANNVRKSGQVAQTQSMFGAAGSLATGGLQAWNNYQQYDKTNDGNGGNQPKNTTNVPYKTGSVPMPK